MPHPTEQQNKQGLLARIYRLKLIITGIALAFLGVLTSLLASWLDKSGSVDHLVVAIVQGLSDVFLVTGAIGIATDFITGRAKDEADDERTSAAVMRAAPAFVAAVLHAIASSPEDLKLVATPELLDTIASNALGLRLDDPEFAREIYTELIDNVVRAPERWSDVDVRLRLSSIDERSTKGAPRFAVTVTWEYTTVPNGPVQKFACTSDRDEFHELVSDVPSTSTWFMTPRPGFDASQRETFELLQYSVDGEERKITRRERQSSQTYSVKIGDDILAEKRAVRIRHVYRTIAAKHGHLLMLTVAQPSKGLTLSVDYTDTDIATLRVSDYVSSASRPRLSQLPDKTEAREITMDVPGWLLPQTEVSFVWTLSGEVPKAVAEAVRLPDAA